MESILSIVASIVSIAAAIWAFFEARTSTSAAARAKGIRDEMVDRRKLVEVSQVYSDTKRILLTLSKIGPSSNPKLLKGINCADIAREVEEYTRTLLEQSSHFSDLFHNSARVLSDDLKVDIEALSEAATPEDKKNAGKNIYYKVLDFMPAVKQVSDEKRERQPLSK